ncbi:MAG TPA: hypothetical protein PL155_01055 [Candidatus Omnitrophota bacterium]|nr:hypothetical protein [Candidatus Omnitrophota bacterium]HPD84926.1 hypothetical protein [Candidatus Omnitrophota bacterium]HRZ03784.1 hypothetical protein [Candidatus Omnitrophota bacterium]
MNAFKRLLVYVSAVCFLLTAPEILLAGSIKGKMQQRINVGNSMQYQSGSQTFQYSGSDFSGGKEELKTSLETDKKDYDRPATSAPADEFSPKKVSSLRADTVLSPAILSSYAIYNVVYKSEIDENVVTVTGEVIFEVFKKEGWTQIPLVGDSVGLVDVKVNKGKSFVINQDGKYYLMIDKPGRYNLNIEFLIKANREREGGPGNFKAEMIPAPLSQFEFTIPGKDIQVFIEPAIKVETTQENDKTMAWAIMPNTSSADVRWTTALPKQQITVTEKLEPKLYAETSTTSSVGGGVIKNQSRIEYSILQSEVASLRVALPEDVSVLNVSADNLRDWKPSKKDGVQYVDVFLNYGVKGKYVLNVVYERNIGEGSQVVEMPWIKAAGVERENGFYGIAASTNVELAVKSKDKVTEIDTKQLPSSVWSTSSNPILLAFKYLNDGFKIDLEITRHEELPVLIATIDSADHIMLRTKEGKILTKVTYHIRNNVKQYLRLNLPKDVSIWSSFVSGAPVKPAKDDKGNILIPLQKSELKGKTLTTFPVEIVYLDKGESMKWFGSMKLSLPTTDVPISECHWSVYLPYEYSYFSFGGDVQNIADVPYTQSHSGGLGGAVGSFASRGVQGRFKDSADNIGEQYEPGYLSTQFSVGRGGKEGQQSMQMPQAEGALTKGVLPIEISIPRQGKLFRFSKLLVVEGESPWLKVSYTSVVEKVKKPVKVIIWLAILVLVVRIFIMVKKRKAKSS